MSTMGESGEGERRDKKKVSLTDAIIAFIANKDPSKLVEWLKQGEEDVPSMGSDSKRKHREEGQANKRQDLDSNDNQPDQIEEGQSTTSTDQTAKVTQNI